MVLAPAPSSKRPAPAPTMDEGTAPPAVPEISQAPRESIASQLSTPAASIQTQVAATDTQAYKRDSSFAKETKLDTSKQPSTGKPAQNASETSEKVKAVKHEPKTDADAENSTHNKFPSDPPPPTDIPSASLEHKDRVEQEGETQDQRAQEELDPDAEARAKRKKEKRKKKKRKEKRRARELSPDRMADKMISSRTTRSDVGRGNSLQQNGEIESAYFTSKSSKRKDKVKIKFEKDDDCEVPLRKIKRSLILIKRKKWEPPNWQEQLKNIKEMRKDRTAPVDTMMGWDRVCDPEAKPETIRYQVLISLLLSSATKDEVNVPAAMGRLKTAGCDVDSILKMSDKQLGELISPVGLWKKKVRYIKGTTKILQEKYEGDVPRTVNELCDLPGIGRKMAYLIMNCVWGKVLSIGVEAHVHRISNRLGWVSTWDTEETRRALQDWLPREPWRDIDVVLVGFGQTVCKPIFTMCDICLNQDICPSAFKKCLSKKSVKV